MAPKSPAYPPSALNKHSANQRNDRKVITMYLRTATMALACTLGLGGIAHAEIVEGIVTAVQPNGQLLITLPDGIRVSEGDGVQVLAEIPGLGPVAITSQWRVTGTKAGTVTATPEEPPSGTPQVGYLVRIDTQTAVLDPVLPATDPNTPEDPNEDQSLPEFVDAMNIYLAARDLSYSRKHPDLTGAADLYRRSADMGYDPAMTELGAVLSFGFGVNRDDGAALDWQVRAAGLGNTDAMHRLGLIYLAGRGVPVDESRAADWFRKAADQGNDNAMFLLAMLYENGVGVPASMIEMVNWLEKAASRDNTNAMFFLGHIYLGGEDGVIPENNQKAEEYWLAAANAGNAEAMNALAELYKDRADGRAQQWADAARNAPQAPEYAEDLRCLSHWECYAPDAGSPRADPAPQPWVEPQEPTRPERSPRVTYVVQDCDRYAAAAHDPDRPDQESYVDYSQLDARRVISECTDDINEWPDTRRFYAQIARGYYKNEMYSKAFEAAMTGAELGSSQAMAFVGTMYKLGNPVPQDSAEALRWLEKAGNADNITAMHFAAGMHLYAEGVPYNPQAAAYWFQTAADYGSPNAYTNLGILYDNGQGVPFDPEEAAANLMIGLATGDDQAKELLLQNPNSLTRHTRIAIQQFLYRDGFYNGAYDGDFGPQTMRALQAKIMN